MCTDESTSAAVCVKAGFITIVKYYLATKVAARMERHFSGSC